MHLPPCDGSCGEHCCFLTFLHRWSVVFWWIRLENRLAILWRHISLFTRAFAWARVPWIEGATYSGIQPRQWTSRYAKQRCRALLKDVQLAAIAARHSMAVVSGSKGYRQRARVLDMIRPRNVGAAHLIASAPFIFCVRQTAPFGRNRASRNPRSQRSPQHGRVDHGAYGSSTIYRGVQNLQDFGPGREMPEDPSDMEHQLFWSTCRPLQVWLCYTGSRKSL